MYVLVSIAIAFGMIDVRAENFLYPDYNSCMTQANLYYRQLMETKPIDSAEAFVFCAKVPEQMDT